LGLFDIILIAAFGLVALVILWIIVSAIFGPIVERIGDTSSRVQVGSFSAGAILAILGTVGSGANFGIVVIVSLAVGAVFWFISLYC
jgi:hypothetical protein